jgi:hypothetical protein
MNGRAYDYNLGRFTGVDPFIQFPLNSQSLNPYSYILNNPLSGTDPTGYCAAETGSHIKSCEVITVTDTKTGESASGLANKGTFGKLAASGIGTLSNGGDNGGKNIQSVVGQKSSVTGKTGTDRYTPTADQAKEAQGYTPKNVGLVAGDSFSSYDDGDKFVMMEADKAMQEVIDHSQGLQTDSDVGKETNDRAARVMGGFRRAGGNATAYQDIGDDAYAKVGWNKSKLLANGPDSPDNAVSFRISLRMLHDLYVNGAEADIKSGYRFPMRAGRNGFFDLFAHEFGHFDPQSMVSFKKGQWGVDPAMERSADTWMSKIKFRRSRVKNDD